MQKLKKVSKINFLFFILVISMCYILMKMSINSMILCSSFIFMILLLMLYKPKSGGIDIFEPLYFFSGTIALVFYIAPMAWIIRDQIGYQGLNVMHMLPLATLYVNLGFIAFYLGYTERRIIKFRKPRKIRGLKLINTAWIILIISIIFALIYDKSKGIGLRDIFLYFSSIKTSKNVEFALSSYHFMGLFHNSMISAYLIILYNQKKYKLVTFFLGIFIALLLLVSGSRYRLLIFLIAPIIVYYLNEHKRPSSTTISIGLIGMFLVTSVVGITRTAFKTGEAVGEFSLKFLIEAFSYNIDVFFPFYRIVDFMPTYLNYQYGMSYIEIILQFIPRAIWPNKPETTMFLVMNQAFGKLASGGPSYTIFGEHYVEFGLAGIIVVLFLIGKFFKSLWKSTKEKDNIIYNIEYAILFIYILQLVTRGHTTSKMFELIFFCSPFIIFKRCIR